ncbi:LacI family DNA-binding transcriptional regulator [Alloscardovia venturai]|uniref:LacI family DNA-binding transcriptional regulator n=1 Tax=Alloscardovia venturai TaxID=1769421 RepID=A0ABW2Y6M2_9BIFI
MKSSIEDVAQAAGVSTATVSRVFSHPERVSPSTQQRVRKAAEKLDFYISRSAGLLKSGRSMRVALLVGSSKIDWFTGRIIEGINTVFRDTRYDLVIFPICNVTQRKEFFENLPLRGNVDAVIVSSFAISAEEIERLSTAHLPIIGINISDTTGFTASVSIDDREGTSIGVRYLAQLGHKNIAYCYETFDEGLNFSSAQRIDGFSEACDNAGIRSTIITIKSDEDGFNTIYSQLLSSRNKDVTALFFHQDSLAVPFIFKAQHIGLAIPEHLSVLGYDNSTFSGEVGLSTIKQKPLDTAIKAAQKALALVDGDMSAATHDIEPVQLLIRSSTSRARAL